MNIMGVRKYFRILFSLFIVFSLPMERTIVLGAPGDEPDNNVQFVKKGIVILTAFPGIKPQVGRNHVQHRFSQQLDAYVREMSYGKVALSVDITRNWVTLPHPVGDYAISSRNLEVDDSRLSKLIRDALAAADEEVDFSEYDFVVLYLAAQLQEYGMIGLCGYPGMLGWSAKDKLKSKSGEEIRGVAIFCYQAHLGTLFHDVAHVIGGVQGDKRVLPCLYDHDLQAKPGNQREIFEDALINMGFWDPMSCHFYKRESGPPGISSWTKLRLGWIDESRIKTVLKGETAEVILDPLESDSSQILVIRVPLSETNEVLIENRQPLGFDQNLPGSGVLILYTDDTVKECRHGQAPVRLVDAHPDVEHLKGAAFDIGGKTIFQDKKNGIEVRLLEKTGDSYRISVSHK